MLPRRRTIATPMSTRTSRSSGWPAACRDTRESSRPTERLPAERGDVLHTAIVEETPELTTHHEAFRCNAFGGEPGAGVSPGQQPDGLNRPVLRLSLSSSWSPLPARVPAEEVNTAETTLPA